MRITILTLGTHGDVRPFVALGIGLQQAGHSVRLAGRDNYREFVTGHGLEFASLGEAPGAPAPEDVMTSLRRLPQKVLHAARVSASFLPGWPAPAWPGKMPWLDQLMADSFKACQGADAVISGFLFLWVSAFAEKLNVPWFVALLQPCTPTRAFPNLFFTAAFPSIRLGGRFNLLTHQIAVRLFYSSVLRLTNPGRQQLLGLKPLATSKSIAAFYKQQAVVLYAYSPTLSPKPVDWPAQHDVTGFWFLDEDTKWSAPAELIQFLAAGPTPVYVGFGSFSERNPQRLTAIVVEALAKTRQRGILLTGWGGFSKSDLPDTIFPIQSVPHSWLFPRVSAVVHHGGAGTVGAALRAGVPSVSIPWRGDHPFFARCAYEIGASPPPIPKKQLTAARLAQAIEAAVHDERIRERAQAAADRIAKENGVARAIRIIEESVRQGRSLESVAFR